MAAIKFGVKTGHAGYSCEELKKLWTNADELGYDSAWLCGHFFPPDDRRAPCLEAWTTLAALAAATKRLRLGTMVTSISHRHPSVLAKMATTVDIISNGRLIMGVGAGLYEEEYLAYGYDFPTLRTRIRQLKEALIVTRKLWTEERTTFNGQFYSLHDAISSPKPRQSGGPPIMVGIMKGKRSLRLLAARYADGFNTPSPLGEYKAILASICGNRERYGRRTDDLIVSWQGSILIGKPQSEIERIMARSAKRNGQSLSAFRQRAIELGSRVG